MTGTTYKYGFAAGAGANREDIGGKRKSPKSRAKFRQSQRDSITEAFEDSLKAHRFTETEGIKPLPPRPTRNLKKKVAEKRRDVI